MQHSADQHEVALPSKNTQSWLVGSIREASMDRSTSFELDWRNGLGLALSVLVAFISGPGGQGGGSFYIPLFTVLLDFTVNQAAALSSAVVFFGCITMVTQAVATNHPDVPALPVVDYTLVLSLTPILCLGLALGVLVNEVISQWLLNILVILVWTWSCIQLSFTYRRARKQEREHQANTEQQQQQQQQEQEQEQQLLTAAAAAVVVAEADSNASSPQTKDVMAEGDHSLATHSQQSVQPPPPPQQQQQPGHAQEPTAVNIIEKVRFWASCQPWKLIGVITIMFSFFIAMQAIRGSVTRQCSVSYWVVIALLCAVSLLAGIAVACWLMHKTRQLNDAQAVLPVVAAAAISDSARLTQTPAAVPAKGSTAGQSPAGQNIGLSRGIYGSVVHYTSARILTLNIQMFIAGLMLAVWPLSPIIMALPGMHPQVAAGTSKVMLFLITGGSALSFLAHSQLNIGYMLAYGTTNAVATPLGVWVVDKFIRRTGRPSILLMMTIVRLAVCVVVHLVFEAVPRFVGLSHGLPRAGFMPEPMCPS